MKMTMFLIEFQYFVPCSVSHNLYGQISVLPSLYVVRFIPLSDLFGSFFAVIYFWVVYDP